MLKNIDFANKDNLEMKATREAFGEEIVRIAEENEKVVVVNADLPGSLKLDEFIKKFPDRYIQVGVAEQAMASIGTGLALAGKIPLITSFAAFSPSLNWSQIRLAASTNINLKIISSHYGVNVGEDGSSAQMLEDVALMRVLPNMTVTTPADSNQTKLALIEVIAHEGISYLRLTRSKFPVIYEENSSFSLTSANHLSSGDDLTLVATGSTVYEALLAVQELKDKGITVDLFDVHTVKPLDVRQIRESLNKTGKLLVVEEHQIACGLGSAILESLDDHNFKHKLLGVNDQFGQSGNGMELMQYYGIAADSIAKSAVSLM